MRITMHMTVGIATPVPEVIYYHAVNVKKEQSTDDLRSPQKLVIDIHATRLSKKSTFSEASKEHFEKLKQQQEHEKHEKAQSLYNFQEM